MTVQDKLLIQQILQKILDYQELMGTRVLDISILRLAISMAENIPVEDEFKPMNQLLSYEKMDSFLDMPPTEKQKTIALMAASIFSGYSASSFITTRELHSIKRAQELYDEVIKQTTTNKQ